MFQSIVFTDVVLAVAKCCLMAILRSGFSPAFCRAFFSSFTVAFWACRQLAARPRCLEGLRGNELTRLLCRVSDQHCSSASLCLFLRRRG